MHLHDDRLIITTKNPSCDGHFAVWLLDYVVPAWRGSRIKYVGSDEEADFLCRENPSDTIAVNVGTGPFSGHPHEEHPDDCAATLVARHFGLENSPALKRLIHLAVLSDKLTIYDISHPEGVGSYGQGENLLIFTIPPLIKNMYIAGFTDFAVYKWASMTYFAEYVVQWRFHGEARRALAEDAQYAVIPTGSRETLKTLVGVVSDERLVHKAARTKYGQRADFLLLGKSSGNWGFFSFNNYNVDQVVPLLRHAEMLKQGRVPSGLSFQYLQQDGMVPEAWGIYYHRDGNQILNGSPTHPDVRPTKLSFDEVWDLIQISLIDEQRAAYWDTKSVSLEDRMFNAKHAITLVERFMIEEMEKILVKE